MRTKAIANTRLLLPFVSILLFSFAASAQPAACSLKFDQLKPSADLYGLHLGMTTDEVRTALPLIQFGRPDRLGVMRTSFNPHFDQRVDKAAFPDVRTISLDFLDGKLATIWIG